MKRCLEEMTRSSEVLRVVLTHVRTSDGPIPTYSPRMPLARYSPRIVPRNPAVLAPLWICTCAMFSGFVTICPHPAASTPQPKFATTPSCSGCGSSPAALAGRPEEGGARSDTVRNTQRHGLPTHAHRSARNAHSAHHSAYSAHAQARAQARTRAFAQA